VIVRFIAVLALVLGISTAAFAQLEWDKPSKPKPFANPSSVRVARDEAIPIVKKILEEQGFVVKSETLDQSRGVSVITTEPLVFTKGLVADTQFKHFADVRAASVQRFVRGRVTLRVEVAPVDPSSSSVGIGATFQGLVERAIQPEWISAPSKGLYEDRLLCFVVTRANGDTRDCDTNEL